MVTIEMTVIFSLNTLEINVLSLFWQLLVSDRLNLGASSQMNCVFVTCFAGHLDHILRNVINSSAKYLQFI